MITFSQYITELFNQHYDYTKGKVDYNQKADTEKHKFHFHTDNGNKIHVEIKHHPSKNKKVNSEVSFYTDDHDPDKHDDQITNKEGRSSAKVFSTVHHILRDHLQKHKHIEHVSFASEQGEPSRTKLYRHLAKSFAQKHTEHESEIGRYKYTNFNIHRNDIKG